MAMEIPVNPPVAIYGQKLATGEKNYVQFIQNSIKGHRWSNGRKPLATDEKLLATGGNPQFSKW